MNVVVVVVFVSFFLLIFVYINLISSKQLLQCSNLFGIYICVCMFVCRHHIIHDFLVALFRVRSFVITCNVIRGKITMLAFTYFARRCCRRGRLFASEDCSMYLHFLLSACLFIKVCCYSLACSFVVHLTCCDGKTMFVVVIHCRRRHFSSVRVS